MKKLHLFASLSLLLTSCTIEPSSVSFKLDFYVDNSVYYTINTQGKQVIALPPDPVKEDYTFDAWYWDKDVWKRQFTANSLLDTALTSNMAVYAHFLDIDSTVGTDCTFEGAELRQDESIGEYFYYKVHNPITTLAVYDYVKVDPLSSWTLTSDINGNNIIQSKKISLEIGNNTYFINVKDKNENVKQYTLIVRRLPMYAVSFNANGGTTCSNQTIEEESFVTDIPTTTKTGHTFVEWDYDFNKAIMSNLTINAIWNANEYNVSFELSGGEMDEELNVIYIFGTQVNLPTPSKTGHRFDGWYRKDNNQRVYSGKWAIDSDIVLVASWSANTYYIIYDVNGGNPLNSQAVIYGNTFTLATPNRTNYRFDGWYYNGELFEGGTWNYTQNITLIAHWTYLIYSISFASPSTINPYYVTFDDGLGNINTIEVKPNEAIDLPIPDGTKDNYAFCGWTKTLNGIDYVNNRDTINDTLTLYAKWSKVTNYSSLNAEYIKPNYTAGGDLYIPDPYEKSFVFYCPWIGEYNLSFIFSNFQSSSKLMWDEDENAFTKTWDSELKQTTYTLSFNVDKNASRFHRMYIKGAYSLTGHPRFTFKNLVFECSEKNPTASLSSTPQTYSIDVKIGSNFDLGTPIILEDLKTFDGWYTEQNGNGTKLTDSFGKSLEVWNTFESITAYPYFK